VNQQHTNKAGPCDGGDADVVSVADKSQGQDPGDPVIRLVDVHISFDGQRVITGVTLDIMRGQTTVILGPSGTGKSVLLKLIVGLLKPDRGEVYLNNQRVDQLGASELVEARKKIGFLFQQSALFDSMTVGENVCFPMVEHTKFSVKQRKDRCMTVMRIVGLEGVEMKMPAHLSGGQRKRVALARAIVLEPEIVMYDEPTTGLDPIRADVIDELIKSLSNRLGITSVVVTHDLGSAQKVADRMVMLFEGQIIEDGTPQSFCQSENALVRQFVRGQADQLDLDRIRSAFEPINDPASR